MPGGHGAGRDRGSVSHHVDYIEKQKVLTSWGATSATALSGVLFIYPGPLRTDRSPGEAARREAGGARRRWRERTTDDSAARAKTITTGEGGMATTQNAEWADRMRIMSLHGISRNAWSRYSANGSWRYNIGHAGFKYNLSDLAATLGIEQLKKCDQFYEIREHYAGLYNQGFKDLPEITCPPMASNVQHAWHLYVIQLDLDQLRIGRNEFIDILKKYNIGTSVHFIPLHLHPYYQQTYGYRAGDFPIAGTCFERIISLPIYPKMTEAAILVKRFLK